MSDTHTQLRVHFVWSTKYREPLIDEALEPTLYEFIGGILRKRKHCLMAAGGMPEHVHLLVGCHPQYAISELVRDIKANSSVWIRQERPSLKRFAWQVGYGAFSVSRSIEPKVVNYILTQKTHHATQSFESEYIELLKLHDIPFNEEYLWN
ncbi:MAG: IS200/IS605 family transposase [Aureliella sp.]